ncbi:MAG: glutamate racemase [Candidatus Uhrbacteria bacterium]|nr:glutamate racemase [Patescibacteria group bacterium]MBU1907130.1 glutamate racemase [Patescibacteria group bacterium]
MIGVFDSGYGGLTVLRELVDQLPEYSYIYLGDNAREPYGPHTEAEIFRYTLEGVEFLFAQGCELILLACNTVSAGALRRLQQEVLPAKYPDKRVLGILVPSIEKLTGIPWKSPVKVRPLGTETRTVGVLGTEATVRSAAYTKEIKKRDPNMVVFEQACPALTTLIVAAAPEEELRKAVRQYLDELYNKMREQGEEPPPSALLLGCTHFAIIKDLIESELPDSVELVEQSSIVAETLRYYLERHSDLESRLNKSGQRIYYTTGDPTQISMLGSKYFGGPIKFESVNIAL